MEDEDDISQLTLGEQTRRNTGTTTKKNAPPSLGNPYKRATRISKSNYDPFENDPGVYPLKTASSVLLPRLQQSEKEFFKLVAEGDVQAVTAFLQANPNFNINCINFQGVTALHEAVHGANEAMVKLLLDQPDVDLGDSVLNAIRENHLKILRMLLNKIQEVSPELEFVGVTHSSEFPDHMTPLILAAQCGHYEIIEYLMERGHRIAKPHPPGCTCSQCKRRLLDDDQLHAETLRLSLYRAVSSPAYICHATDDPILAAFNLSKETLDCATIRPEFRSAYLELSEDISNFAVELIAACRTTEEIELILRQTNGVQAYGHFVYPRLTLAMEFKQKKFIAHPNTQHLVQAAWHGGWHEWKTKSLSMKAYFFLERFFLLPVITILTILAPWFKLTKVYQIPLNKSITHMAGYTIFLVLLFLESNRDKTGQKRTPPNTGLEPAIIVYVAGYVWNCLRLYAILGARRYFRNMWNIHDVITYTLFLFTFVFWLSSLVDVKANDQIDLERKYWHHLDPILLSEGTFAIAVILAFFRLLYICRLNYYLGPLQISLGKMTADIAKYITIFTIIILAFSAGLCRFYQYYKGMVVTDDSSGIKTAQVDSFVDFESTLKTFFWALFCMSPLESADVIIENLPGETEKATIINKHSFTEAVGYIAFALFEILTVIMILNMLIATMSSTFQRVTDNVDVEWVFGKTEYYMEYMVQTTVPSPFNLIPTYTGLASFWEYMQVLSSNRPGLKAEWNLGHCCYLDREPDERLREQLPALMSQLIQRYFREKDSAAQANTLDAVKMELNELKEALKSS